MKKELNIYLFRHGETTFNRDGKFTGHLDVKLTKKGIEQAKKIAKILRNKEFQVAIYTKLSRSKNNLKYVLRGHPECKKLIEDNRVIERSYGIFEGMSHKDFIKKFGKKKYLEIHRGYKFKIPKGESFYDVEKRVKKFIVWLKRYMEKNNVNVVISAHGNSIRLFRKIIENASVDKMQKWVIPYDKVFIYKI